MVLKELVEAVEKSDVARINEMKGAIDRVSETPSFLEIRR